MRSELESAFEVLDEVTSCVNASSIMGTEGFLYPIEQFATWQRRVLEDEKYYKDKYGDDEFEFRWAEKKLTAKEIPKWYAEQKHCPVCMKAYESQASVDECKINCEADLDNLRKYIADCGGEEDGKEKQEKK